jgi:hypothetical protein
LKKQNDKLLQQVLDLEATAARVAVDMKQLRRNEGLFREMVLSKAGKPRFTDDQVISEFTTLRTYIQSFVGAHLSNLKDAHGESPYNRRPSDVKFALRAALFSDIYRGLLSPRLFSLGSQESGNPDIVDLQGIETSLGQFEKLLEIRNGKWNPERQ